MGEDSFIGAIGTFAGRFAPHGWADCNGGRVSIKDHEALYSVIGTIYGGDDKTYFNLPDLRPIKDGSPVDWYEAKQPRMCICINGVYPTRD